jgi:hypothetical protein
MYYSPFFIAQELFRTLGRVKQLPLPEMTDFGIVLPECLGE